MARPQVVAGRAQAAHCATCGRLTMNRPTVAAVVPVRDSAETLQSAIRSLLWQTQPPDEIVVVDDGSAVPVQARDLPEGAVVRLLRHETARGPGGARNAGMESTRCDFVLLQDADDLSHPDRLEA